jgi:hypothetical protein
MPGFEPSCPSNVAIPVLRRESGILCSTGCVSLGEASMAVDRELEQLKLLFDYTKFHIGLYTTVATIFGGLVAASDKVPFKFHPTLLLSAVGFICIAGIAGGTIASSIPGYSSYKEFWNAPIAPFKFKGMKAEYWTYVEHGAFWIAVVLALASILVK